MVKPPHQERRFDRGRSAAVGCFDGDRTGIYPALLLTPGLLAPGTRHGPCGGRHETRDPDGDNVAFGDIAIIIVTMGLVSVGPFLKAVRAAFRQGNIH